MLGYTKNIIKVAFRLRIVAEVGYTKGSRLIMVTLVGFATRSLVLSRNRLRRPLI